MLYQFIVENFKTFRDETVLNLASASYSEHPNHVCEGILKNTSFLKTSAIYGANASGKTNLIKAIDFARQTITEGTTGEMLIPVSPFRLSEKCRRSPSRFEFIYEAENRIFYYGFVLFSDKIVEEWLIDKTGGKEEIIFERSSSAGKTKVKAGKKFFKSKADKQLVNFIARTTRVNQLFLKEAFEKNVDPIKPAYRWFDESLQIIPAIAVYRMLEIRTKSDESFSNYLGRILNDVGTGIDSIKAVSLDMDYDKYLPDLSTKQQETITQHIRKSGGAVTIDDGYGNKYIIHFDSKKGPQLLQLKAMHKDEDGELVAFDLKEESEGTRRFLNLLPILYDTQSEDRVYIVDELDRRLHPHLVRAFLELFLNNKESRSQIIFTTHNVNLLDQDLLRLYELIWKRAVA
ncbi:MAG: AAA family ATPase, partial [Balneolaceae bacterium]